MKGGTKVAVWLLVAAGVIWGVKVSGVGEPLRSGLQSALDWIDGLGIWGAVIFVGLYVVATVLMVPGSILTLGAGAIFGAMWGSVWVSVASTVGASLAFLLGRYVARGVIEKKVRGNERFGAIDAAVAKEGWKIVGLTRLSPVFPFTLLNYAFGLTRVKFWHYVVASWVGMMPGTVMYVYLGSLGKAAAEGGGRTTGEWVLYGVGLVATVVVTVYVTRLARKSLAEKIETKVTNDE